MTLQSIRFNSILLASFALITAIILASTDSLTKDKIAASERAAAQRASDRTTDGGGREQHEGSLIRGGPEPVVVAGQDHPRKLSRTDAGFLA